MGLENERNKRLKLDIFEIYEMYEILETYVSTKISKNSIISGLYETNG